MFCASFYPSSAYSRGIFPEQVGLHSSRQCDGSWYKGQVLQPHLILEARTLKLSLNGQASGSVWLYSWGKVAQGIAWI